MGAYDEEINHDSKIFLVAVLISSLFILNSFGNIDENAINSLSFIINLSKSIKLNQTNEANADEISSYFPSLLWLLRDFSLKLEDNKGNVITAKQYLESALQLQKGSSEVVEEKNKIRKLITAYFKERDCFSMVRPIENEKDLQNLQTLEDNLIRREFLEQAETLRNKVFKKVKPKLFNNKILSGSMLIELLSNIIDSINKGAIPVIENSWKYMVLNESIKNINIIIAKFRFKINEFKELNKENPYFFKDLKKFEIESMNALLEQFKRESISPESAETGEFTNKLKIKIQEEFEKFNEDNSKLFENRMNDVLERNTKKLYESFETDKYTKNYYLFFKDLENIKEIAEAIIPDLKNKKEIIFEKIINIIKKFIEMTFLKNKITNDKEIASLKNEKANIQNLLNLKNEDYNKLNNELNSQTEKLNNIYLEFKLKEKNFEEKFKQILNEKKNAVSSAEDKINNMKNELNSKLEKLKEELNKAEVDVKNKEEHLKMFKISEDKIKALNSQKIEYLEKDILNYKQKIEEIKYDNKVLKSTIEEQNKKLEGCKNELVKLKFNEMDNERLKKENEKLLNNMGSRNIFNSNGLSKKLNTNINNMSEFNDVLLFGSHPNNNSNKINLDNMDKNSDGYILIQLIKQIIGDCTEDQNKNISSYSENIKKMIDKISKENEYYLNLNKVYFL